MIDEILKRDILESISYAGTADKTENIIIGSAINLNQIASFNSGSLRIFKSRRFNLIISQPLALTSFNPFTIRCCLCHKVISYPCWYHSIKYTVNHFHYFVCFDKDSSDKVSTRCYRRNV